MHALPLLYFYFMHALPSESEIYFQGSHFTVQYIDVYIFMIFKRFYFIKPEGKTFIIIKNHALYSTSRVLICSKFDPTFKAVTRISKSCKGINEH